MQQLISDTYKQWLTAKARLARRCAEAGNTAMAEKLVTCTMFKGTESIDELMGLFLTSQGLEFCIATNFPDIATVRSFKRCNTERMGIYIDAGEITLTNPGKVVLIGQTVATIKCDSCERHQVAALHGAVASVNASGWSVLTTNADRASNITKHASEHAVILC